MNKRTLSSFIAGLTTVIILSACASTKRDPSYGSYDKITLEKRNDLTQVCMTEPSRNIRLNLNDNEIKEAFKNSLKRKNIKTKFFSNNEIPESCKYVLLYSFAGRSSVMKKGKLTLQERTEEGNNILGQVVYINSRGDVRRKSYEIGFKGQIDEMIDELFKNY